MNQSYMVSILIPIYGVEKYIKRCAESIFQQTYTNLEIIFVDDCTPDNSIKFLIGVLDNFPERKDQTKILHHDHNRGLAAARNTAVAAATGEFVIHVDSDDWIAEDAVELLVKRQCENDFDIVTGRVLSVFKHYTVEKQTTICDSKEVQIKKYLEQSLEHTIWGRLIRRSLYTENQIQAKEGVDIGEDWQVIPQLFYYASTYSWINQLIYYYNCSNENSYMATGVKSYEGQMKKGEANLATANILKDFFKGKDIDVENQIEDIIVGNITSLLIFSCRANHKDKFQRYYNDLKNIESSRYPRILKMLVKVRGNFGVFKFLLSLFV